MSNFSEFINQTKNGQTKESINLNNNNTSNIPNNEKLEDMIDKYSKYSSSDLLTEFLKLTSEKKRNGELSSYEIEKMKETILPFLNENQKLNLEKILDVVRNV